MEGDLRTNRLTDGQTYGQMEGQKEENYVPPLFFEKAGDKNKAREILKLHGIILNLSSNSVSNLASIKSKIHKELEDHWSCSSPERLSHCKLMRFKLIENRPMKVYAWTLLTPGAWPNLTQGHDWHNL